MLDHATLIRQALITALKDDPAVSEIVADRVHDEVSSSPTWDFIRFDPPSQTKYESSCGVGRECEWRIHLFARGPGTKGVMSLESKVFSLLDETELSIPSFSRFDIDFVRSNTGPDGDSPSDYHTVMVYQTVSVEA